MLDALPLRCMPVLLQPPRVETGDIGQGAFFTGFFSFAFMQAWAWLEEALTESRVTACSGRGQ